MSSTHDPDARKVKSLRDLPQSIEPPPGLWLRIEEEIAPRRGLSFGRGLMPRYSAAAAVVLALLIGALAGHYLLPESHPAASLPPHAQAPNGALPVSFIRDPSYQRQRAELLANLSERVAALPPPARQKVLASLATLQQSIRDLQAALGRDPSNALLQELLVDTCQDEMRVLVSVNEAGQDATQL